MTGGANLLWRLRSALGALHIETVDGRYIAKVSSNYFGGISDFQACARRIVREHNKAIRKENTK